ncbi:putative syntaxin 1A [Paratrimastix pyriformis]|uniref:Syntaxin 1A n=1 Tax=Paratrimastix pyriformis TaxID=342808 RepID=A0ABQ8UKN6_9EUKA|nr:putative syntaxin 1A [Paratrimastix pyriformis]
MENFADSMVSGGGGGRRDPEPRAAGAGDEEMEGGGENAEFYRQVRTLKEHMEQVGGEIREFVERAERSKETYAKDKMRENEEWIEQRTTALTTSLSRVRTELGQMKDEYEKLPQGCADRRIRRNMHDILTRQFMAVMEEYSVAQANHKAYIKGRAKRTLQTFQGMSEEEADRIAENLNPALADMSTLSSKDAILNHLQERHEAILALESSIRELYEMFNEFAVLVNSQQELLDNVEASIESAHTNMVEGNKNLKQALVHQKKSRKCLCVIFIVLAVVAIVIVAAVLGVAFPKGA